MFKNVPFLSGENIWMSVLFNMFLEVLVTALSEQKENGG